MEMAIGIFSAIVILLVGIYHILDRENSELNETGRGRLGGHI